MGPEIEMEIIFYFIYLLILFAAYLATSFNSTKEDLARVSEKINKNLKIYETGLWGKYGKLKLAKQSQ